MKWSEIRAQYERAYQAARRRGETQTTVALRGNLRSPRTGRPQQHQISKLLRNQSKGPSVETFVRAVEGLGVSVSAFFAAIETGDEQRLAKQIARRPPDTAALVHDAERVLRRLAHYARAQRHR